MSQVFRKQVPPSCVSSRTIRLFPTVNLLTHVWLKVYSLWHYRPGPPVSANSLLTEESGSDRDRFHSIRWPDAIAYTDACLLDLLCTSRQQTLSQKNNSISHNISVHSGYDTSGKNLANQSVLLVFHTFWLDPKVKSEGGKTCNTASGTMCVGKKRQFLIHGNNYFLMLT